MRNIDVADARVMLASKEENTAESLRQETVGVQYGGILACQFDADGL